MSINIIKVNTILKNFYQIEANCVANGDNLIYAFYVYKDDTVIQKFPYTQNSKFLFNLSEPGKYRVRVFVRDDQGNQQALSGKEITFTGFGNELNKDKEKESVIIYGISKNSAFIKAILDKKYKILCFVDDTFCDSEQTFYGLKIQSISLLNEINNNVKVIVSNDFKENTKEITAYGIKNYDVFDFSFAQDNLVIKTMYDMSATELYRISKFCYQNGIDREADFIRTFIQFKFNSFIPYTAEIGEGTRFGYGGIGLVIHKKAKVGENCVISQNVTIGSRGPLPVIGDNVFIGPGAKLLTGKIGSNVVIGANAVVTKDIPDNCVVAGVPAKIISQDMDKYKGYLKKK